ncbi:hypothetical protein MSPP1_003363 [Malassezia sp. CBS 17886]|nr:hypothetical protein MSPP1_003363 [Malassezia sp. CBS 17886]
MAHLVGAAGGDTAGAGGVGDTQRGAGRGAALAHGGAGAWTSPSARSSPSASSASELAVDEFYEMPASHTDAVRRPAGTRVVRGASFGELPHEILLHVFRYVMSSQNDLLSCLLVCKQWCACSVPLMWHRPAFHKLSSLFKLIHVMIQPAASFPYATYVRRLNFSLLAGDLDDQLFGRMAVCARLERLTLAGCSQVSDATLVRVLRCTPQLVAVDLSGVVQLTDHTLATLAAHCARLQGANLSGCRELTSHGIAQLARSCCALRRVKLGHCDQVDSDAFLALLVHCPVLLEADMVHCVRLTDRSVREVWRRATQLRELKLAHCIELTDCAFPTPSLRRVLAAEADQAPGARTRAAAARPDQPGSPLRVRAPSPPLFVVCEQLRILDLSGCMYITDEAVRGIVAHAPRLRSLALAKCARLTDESVYAIARLGRHLQYLHLAHIANLTDRAVVHLAHHCTRIRYLDLACCVQLTDAGIMQLAANLPKLRRIGLVRVCGENELHSLQVANLTDQAIYSLVDRHTTLERIHLSYCENITVPAIFWVTQRLPRLTHLSLTGVPAFQHPELQSMCRAPPKEFNQHQRQSFCVYSGRGVVELRRYLLRAYSDETVARQYGALHPNLGRAVLGERAPGRSAVQHAGRTGDMPGRYVLVDGEHGVPVEYLRVQDDAPAGYIVARDRDTERASDRERGPAGPDIASAMPSPAPTLATLLLSRPSPSGSAS